MSGSAYALDPSDPRAPTTEQWEALTGDEQRRVVDALVRVSADVTARRRHPPHPEGARPQSLREYYRRLRRRVYLSSELPVYCPGEPMFAPDIIAVLDVEPHPHQKWVVAQERRGLDFALEALVSGNRQKDLEHTSPSTRSSASRSISSTTRSASGSSATDSHSGRAEYQPIVPQEGRWASEVLGLDLAMADGRVRFFHGSAPLPEAEELIVRLGVIVDDIVAREQAAQERLDTETRRADEADARAERLAARLRALGVDPDQD